MGETSTFLLLTLVAAVLASGCILWSPSVLSSTRMAQVFYIISAVTSLAALAWILLNSMGMLPRGVQSTELLRILLYRVWIVIGTAIASGLLILAQIGAGTGLRIKDASRSFLRSHYLLRGLCFSVSMSFICTEIGKIAHDVEMRRFFAQSGYPIWFLYFVIATETFGAIGLFFPRTLLPAAFGLSLIMMAAIRTHLHNRDPFSDSLEALHLLVLLACIVLIRLVGERGRPQHLSETGAT